MHILQLATITLILVFARAAAGASSSFCSSRDGKYKLSPFDRPVPGNGNPNGIATWSLTFDDSAAGRLQPVVGFGACVTDSTVAVFNTLPPATLADLLQKLFTSAGANFNLMRHTIASSDLSDDPAYTYDDNGSAVSDEGAPDVNLTNFSLGNRGNNMVAMLRRIRDVNPAVKILGSPWSPPGWMKINKKLLGTTKDNNLNHTYVNSYAQYFVRYLQAYQDGGLTVDAITIQNEPHNSRNGMPTMYIYSDESGHLINDHIGPSLNAAGLKTEIWAWDHNTDDPDYPQTVLNIADRFVKTVAWHCYAKNNDWGVLSRFHERNPNTTQIMTECYTSPKTAWFQAADFTLGPLQNWAGGAIAWVLGTNTTYGPHLSYPDGPCTVCRGLVVVDTQNGTYHLTIDYYMIAQFSKFIPRGATVLRGTGGATNTDGTGIQSVATSNPDGSKTVVIQNKFNNDVYVTVTMTSGAVWSGRVYTKSVVTWVLTNSDATEREPARPVALQQAFFSRPSLMYPLYPRSEKEN